MPDSDRLSRTLLLLSLVAVAAAAVAYRFDRVDLGAICSIVALVMAVVVGLCRGPRTIFALVLLTAAIASVRLLPDVVWPCPVSCQGGALYLELWGYPAPLWATVGLLLVAVLAWRLEDDADVDRREVRGAMVSLLLWLFAGGSLFYLWTAARLDLSCGYCFAVHTGILAAASTMLLRGWWPLPVCGLGFLLLLGAYGSELRVDAPAMPMLPPTVVKPTTVEPEPDPMLYPPDDDCPCFHHDEEAGLADGTAPIESGPEIGSFFAPRPTATTTASVDSVLLRSVDVIRRIGSAQAPVVAEVVIDLYCPHCASALSPLMLTLRPLAASGRLEIIQRFMIRPSRPHGADLAGHVLAAKHADQFQLLVSLLVGSPDDASWSTIRSRVTEIADPVLIETAYVANRQVITAVLESDIARLNSLECRQTPFVVLSKRAGEEIRRWVGDAVSPSEIAATVP